MNDRHYDRAAAKRYVHGTMPDGEAANYEEHFFDCVRCASFVSEETLTDGERALALRPLSHRLRRQIIVAGSLAQAAALVSHGNAALDDGGRVSHDAWSRLSTFVGANSVSFVRRESVWGMKWSRHVAASPEEWLNSMSRRGVRALQLAVHRNDGVVVRVRSDDPQQRTRWHAQQRFLGDQLNRRMWDVTYCGVLDHDETAYRPGLDVDAAATALRAALVDSVRHALAARLYGYHLKLIGALHLLSIDDAKIPHHPDLLVQPHAAARRLAAACIRCWVSPTQTYDEVSHSVTRWRARRKILQRLQDVVLDAFVGATNARLEADTQA
jgi:hypothetical protein